MFRHPVIDFRSDWRAVESDGALQRELRTGEWFRRYDKTELGAAFGFSRQLA
jgi:hypothetical protein